MAELTAKQIELLNGGAPENQESKLGERVSGVLADKVAHEVTIEETFDGAVDANPTVLKMPWPGKVVDAVVECTATNGGGTVRVDRDGSAISDAIVCATDEAVTRIGTIDDAESALAVDEDLELTIANNAAGVIRVRLIRTGN